MSYKQWLILWSLWLCSLVQQPTVPILTRHGWVQGSLSADGSYIQYFSIPYATASKRFQVAQPSPKWDDILDATQSNGVRCPQRESLNLIIGQEDCLFLNVYTPAEKSRLLPVMIYIHGGGFREGSGLPVLYGPQYFVRHEIIMVTVNYRLEALGFLNLGIEEAPSNIGVRDQTEAFKWVQKNIKAFGGNPNDVTLFGESAGSVSVFYQLLSPMSKGLFHKVIMQSGSGLSSWGLQRDPMSIARSYVKQMGYDSEDPKEIYRILITKSPKELLRTRVPRPKGSLVLNENIFVPCVDKEILGLPSFLPDDPYNLLSKGSFSKVPILIGFNDAEGYWFAGKENRTTISNFDIDKSLPNDLLLNETERNEVTETIKKFYFNNNMTKSDEFMLNLAKFEGDIGITYPTVETIDILLKTTNLPVFSYMFAYRGWLNLPKVISGFRNYPGATHADELFYMFKTEFPLPAALEVDMINKMTTLWTNFAKFSNPTPQVTSLLPLKWKATDKTDPKLLIIDSQFSMQSLWEDKYMKFWKTLYEKYKRKV